MESREIIITYRWWNSNEKGKEIPANVQAALEESAEERILQQIKGGSTSGQLVDCVRMNDDEPEDGVEYQGWWGCGLSGPSSPSPARPAKSHQFVPIRVGGHHNKVQLPVHDILVQYAPKQSGAGSITCNSDCYKTCPACGERHCLYQCDGSHEESVESEKTVSGRHRFNGAIDGILSLILAHACAGIDIESSAYLEGIETAFDAIATSA